MLVKKIHISFLDFLKFNDRIDIVVTVIRRGYNDNLITEVLPMEWWQIALIVLAVVAVVLAVLYFVGRKLQTKADGQQEMINQQKK